MVRKPPTPGPSVRLTLRLCTKHTTCHLALVGCCRVASSYGGYLPTYNTPPGTAMPVDPLCPSLWQCWHGAHKQEGSGGGSEEGTEAGIDEVVGGGAVGAYGRSVGGGGADLRRCRRVILSPRH